MKSQKHELLLGVLKYSFVSMTLGSVVLMSPKAFGANLTFSGTVEFDGTNKGVAEEGLNPKGEKTKERELLFASKEVVKYDGETKFKAEYTIELKPDKTPDLDKSTVTFFTITYTTGGKLGKSNFKTFPISITKVELTDGDPPAIKSFDFLGDKWDPDREKNYPYFADNGLKGSINLKDGTANYEAKYSRISTGAIYKYQISATKTPDKPGESPLPDEFGNPEIFTPGPEVVPEPLTILGAITAAGFGTVFKHKLAKNKKT